MATNPKRELYDAIDGLSDDEVRRLSAALRGIGTTDAPAQARPLTEADIVVSTPILPDDENADDMIERIRGWRREGGHA